MDISSGVFSIHLNKLLLNEEYRLPRLAFGFVESFESNLIKVNKKYITIRTIVR